MDNLKEALKKKIYQSQFNNFGSDNYDQYRFGKNPEVEKPSYVPPKGFMVSLKQAIKKIIGASKDERAGPEINLLKDQIEGLQRLYPHLNEKDKKLLVDLIAFRQMGLKKVKLPRNNQKYWQAIATANSLQDEEDTYDPKFLHFILNKFDLTAIGLDIRLYYSNIGIAVNYLLEQYAYKLNGENIIEVEKDDVVLDIGACWGDTALYFANKTGPGGKVYSFEFIPGNIRLFNINVNLNPNLKDIIELVEHPVSNKSSQQIYYKDFGPGSVVIDHPFEDQTGQTTTISIDDFVNQNNVSRVDFIKMDIEGAEPNALLGARETIRKFRPKLAIAIYHSIDDFVNIPNWILDMNLDYELYLDHFTIHEEETICFARPKNVG